MWPDSKSGQVLEQSVTTPVPELDHTSTIPSSKVLSRCMTVPSLQIPSLQVFEQSSKVLPAQIFHHCGAVSSFQVLTHAPSTVVSVSQVFDQCTTVVSSKSQCSDQSAIIPPSQVLAQENGGIDSPGVTVTSEVLGLSQGASNSLLPSSVQNMVFSLELLKTGSSICTQVISQSVTAVPTSLLLRMKVIRVLLACIHAVTRDRSLTVTVMVPPLSWTIQKSKPFTIHHILQPAAVRSQHTNWLMSWNLSATSLNQDLRKLQIKQLHHLPLYL